MPQMGVSVSEGTVTKWLKSVGDHIEADEPIVEISTDKVDTEVPSPGSGMLSEIFVQEGQTVVDRGPYRLVRHPSYTGALLVYLGLCFGGCVALVLRGTDDARLATAAAELIATIRKMNGEAEEFVQ